MTAVEVVVPWRDGCEHRRRALRWVLARWYALHPEWPVTLAEAPPGPWIKALAVMPAIASSPAPIIVVADADVWCPAVADAVEHVRCGAAWAIPHGMVHRLTESATAALYAGLPADQRADLAEPPYYGVATGGLVVVERSVALDTPLDPRFVGWGGEDHAWGFALGTLYGIPPRGTEPLTHLWHPPAERESRRVGSYQSEQLRRRYRDARVSAEDIRRIVSEVPRPWDSNASRSTAKASSSC